MKNIHLLKTFYEHAKSRRYHNKPKLNQNLQEHSFGVALIISMLHPNPSAELLKAALMHDFPEGKYGDLLAPLKFTFPEAEALDKKLNDLYWEEMEFKFPDLTDEEKSWLYFADKYECILFLRSDPIANKDSITYTIDHVKDAYYKLTTINKEYGYLNSLFL